MNHREEILCTNVYGRDHKLRVITKQRFVDTCDGEFPHSELRVYRVYRQAENSNKPVGNPLSVKSNFTEAIRAAALV